MFNPYGGSFTGLKRPRHEADHLLLSSVEVKNKWNYTCHSHTRHHAVQCTKWMLFGSMLRRRVDGHQRINGMEGTAVSFFMVQDGDRELLHNVGRVQLTCDGTRWRTGGQLKGKLANWLGSQYTSHYLGTWFIQHYYRWCTHRGCE